MTLPSKLSTQAWVRRKTPVRSLAAEHFRPVPVEERPRAKPTNGSGGLWTSTYDERFGSGWVQWCLSEEFDCDRKNPTFHIWTLEPDPEARVYTIDTYRDLDRLCRLYGRTHTFGEDSPFGPFHDTYPDWSLVAESYDAVHLTDDGQWATRLSGPLNLYGWDCESTLWFRWKFIDMADLGLVYCELQDPWWDESEKETADAVASD